jgi:4-hydroxy-tetrahydrodipicolinate synthase
MQPLAGLKEDDSVVGFYQRFIDKTDGRVPICLQDYPLGSGVHMSVPALLRLAKLHPVVMLKHEPFPGLQKLAQIMAAHAAGEMPGVAVMASSNCLYLPQELARGAHGSITGVALSDVIVRICALHWAGNTEASLDLFDASLPINRREAQGPFGHAVRKEMLRRRGALTSATVRYPGPSLTKFDVAEPEHLFDCFRAAAAALSPPFMLR